MRQSRGELYQNPQDAMRLSLLTEIVDSLEHGLDTELTDGEETLSGGQRQRVGICRALVRKTPIVLFDEVSSALDAISEKALIENILSLEATVIFVNGFDPWLVSMKY